jgi:hypothetical protein
MFKFRDENKESNIKDVAEKLNALSELIIQLKVMEVGVNFTDSERAFDLSLYSTFETKEDLAAYAIHPEHIKVVELIKSVALESKVVDYEI